MNFIYKVKIGSNGYTFANKFDALKFAELAKGHQDYEEKITIVHVQRSDIITQVILHGVGQVIHQLGLIIDISLADIQHLA